MKTLLIDFRSTFRSRVLDLLWRQWNTFGVTGDGARWDGTPIDPEALLLVSCTVARHDARLFDAVLEWMDINGRYINIQRVKRMLADEGFAGEAVFRAIADVTKGSASIAKWANSSVATTGTLKEPEPLFYLSDGRPLPLARDKDAVFADHRFLRDRYKPRNVARPFRPEAAANLILRLRALIGVSARCEILAFLLINGRGSPRSVARQTYFYPATVSKALNEMQDSGYVTSRVEGRRRHYTLTPDAWHELLLREARLTWIVWPRLFRALDQLWLFLHDERLDDKTPLAQASALRRVLLHSAIEKIDSSRGFIFGDLSAHPGETLIPFFTERMNSLLDFLERTGDGETEGGFVGQ